MTTEQTSLGEATIWPDEIPAGTPVIVLADASGRLERGLIESWVEDHAPPGTRLELVKLAPSRRRAIGDRTEARLGALLQQDPSAWVLPLRPAWFPHERNGRRTARWTDVLKLGDPRDPDSLRQRVTWLSRRPAEYRSRAPIFKRYARRLHAAGRSCPLDVIRRAAILRATVGRPSSEKFISFAPAC